MYIWGEGLDTKININISIDNYMKDWFFKPTKAYFGGGFHQGNSANFSRACDWILLINIARRKEWKRVEKEEERKKKKLDH
jgi:hypothetical protein